MRSFKMLCSECKLPLIVWIDRNSDENWTCFCICGEWATDRITDHNWPVRPYCWSCDGEELLPSV